MEKIKAKRHDKMVDHEKEAVTKKMAIKKEVNVPKPKENVKKK